ncbi:MAG: PD-(D/E)XK nuclease family protein [Bacteroidales bacterium]|nr:PD-(D/E)XK nuclease family protein [Bacteroidales bacterium]
MKPFLYKVAEATLSHFKDKISDQTFVFPNRRAGIFFQKHLADCASKPIFSPKIVTVNELFRSFTGYTVMDRTNLLFTLYRHYHKISANDESFDDFVFWGEMILNDFDDVDKYVADARQLFSNIKDLKEIESDFAGLTDEQINSIREFWFNFQPQKQGKTKDEFLATWKILYPLYQSFREELQQQSSVYEGMIFREVAENILQKIPLNLPKGKYIFVGLNALSRSEEILLEHLHSHQSAEFFWDTESEKTTDPDNRASHFINRYCKIFPSNIELEQELSQPAPHIELIGISSATGQAKQVYSILNKWLAEKAITDSDKAINTAIVLPDEQLLMPTLYSIPEVISTINVTMGYPLSSSPIAGLMEHIFAMQTHWRTVFQQPAFYYRFLLPVLNHRYIASLAPQLIKDIYKQTLNQNKVFIAASEFAENKELAQIFLPLDDKIGFTDYLLNIIQLIQKQIDTEISKEETEKHNLVHLEKEFIYQYYITVNRMKEIMQQTDMQMSMETLFRLLRKMIAGISIPFQGEPLSGLQVMGVLETRALDFDNLIILSMNEGVFPLKGATNSFIPYNLRKGFGLSTYEHQDSVYAYHFYRMIHRAKNIYLLYDTRSEGMQTGEVSRYVYQMKYHYRMNIVEKLLTFDVSLQKNIPIVIPKNERILKALSNFLEGGERALSASSINTYLDCSLKFYFREIEKMSEEEEISEELEASQFGTIFHQVMERLYYDYKNTVVTDEVISGIQKNNVRIKNEIEEAFRTVVFHSEKSQHLTGHNYLIGNVIQRYVKQVLEIDRKLTPFVYRESEEKMEDQITARNGLKIRLKGSIDRIDEVGNKTRIIDYKTGTGKSNFSSIEELFDSTQKNRPKAVMQVFFYSWLYDRKHHSPTIAPGIYYLREMFSDFKSTVIYNPEPKKKEFVENFAEFRTQFEDQLFTLMESIFDPVHPFKQTEIVEHCQYCEFKDICRKE